MRRACVWQKKDKGQAIIELALIAPLCVLLLLGTIDLLRACYQQHILNRAARAAVRRAIVEPKLNSNTVPEDVIIAEAIRILEVGNVDPSEVDIQIKVPGFNYLVGQADLTTDPIIVSITHDFQSFLTSMLAHNSSDPLTLFTIEGVGAGYYEDIGTVIDMGVLEDAYPEFFEEDQDDGTNDGGETKPPPPPPPDRDGDGVRDSWDAFPDDPSEQWDSDRDGVGNRADPDDDNDGLDDSRDPSPYDSDIDDDGIKDGADPDMDNDGIPNNEDPNPGSYNAPSSEG